MRSIREHKIWHGRGKGKGTGGIQFAAGGDGQAEAKVEVAPEERGSLSARLSGLLKFVEEICTFITTKLSERCSWFFREFGARTKTRQLVIVDFN